ncbi:MAG: hypothetical protein NT076_04735 [Candidatus Pacearchaeota archaeon]|nr:hypothetical protein [Candidatus Pacearchaeota archaeon]
MPQTRVLFYSAEVKVVNGSILRNGGFKVSPVGEYALVSRRAPRDNSYTEISGPIPAEGVVIRVRRNPTLRVEGEFISSSADSVYPEIREKLVAGIEVFLNNGYVARTKKIGVVDLGLQVVTFLTPSDRRRCLFCVGEGRTIRDEGSGHGRRIHNKAVGEKG